MSNKKKKGKIKVSKAFLSLLLSGALIGGSGLIFKLGKEIGTREISLEYSDDNEIGYDDISFISNFGVDDRNFVILDVGDHDTIGENFQNRKMRLCNEKDISLGIIITSDAENECDIYNDVEYAKSLVRDYKIDFPVYLDIDNIMDNKKLNNEMKSKIIKDFLDKCSANGMYVGMCGRDINLCRIKQYYDIKDYDSFLIMDTKEIKYDGSFTIYKDLKGNIRSKSDISKSIDSKKLNTEEKFVQDAKYIVHGEEEVLDIALKYGMSVSDLLEFNELKPGKVKDGTIIRIPCKIVSEKKIETTEKTEEQKQIVELEQYKVGCDISYCQADNNNWDKLKENFDYIILKCSQGLNEDPYFEKNARNCNIEEIPIGVYVYNEYWKDNYTLEKFKKLQQQQADYAVSLLNNKKIDYPVYLDIEKTKFTENDLPSDYARAMLDIWYNTISSAGYIPGVYYNGSTATIFERILPDYDIPSKFEVWLAGGEQYNKKDENGTPIRYSIDEMKIPEFFINGEHGAHMCQPGMVVDAGSGTSAGYLDIDFSKVDYTTTYTTKEEEIEIDNNDDSYFAIKEFNRVPKAVPITLTTLGLLGGSALGIRYYNLNKLKRKKNKVKSKK